LRIENRYKKKKHTSPVLVGVLLFISVIFVSSLILSPEASSNKDPGLAAEARAVLKSPPAPPATPKGPVKTLTVREKDTFYTIMSSLGAPPAEILRIVEESKGIYDLRKLKKGDSLNVGMSGDVPERVEYMYGDLEGLVVERDQGGPWRVEKQKVPHYVETTLASGVIETSLYEAGIGAGIETRIVHALSDIFAWDVDFALDIRKGDTFKVLYETLYVGDLPVSAGRVLGAEMVNSGKTFTAVYFEDASGRGDYYDERGASLSRTLLKSPLRYSRISSYFAKKRFHPILKKRRAHHGVDYAAPTGTPVESAGDGRVVFAGWKKGYGKFIKIRHNSKYTTAYGHLSRIKKGIKKGRRVRQGEVIGRVGSTGLSTGPHLHYEVLVWDKHVNPLSVKSSSRGSVGKKDKDGFTALFGEIRENLTAADSLVIATGP
jgi:murein DD-endopeptidase MepM/ murein hydrolase activator NlpD